jgi:hypothetical protein
MTPKQLIKERRVSTDMIADRKSVLEATLDGLMYEGDNNVDYLLKMISRSPTLRLANSTVSLLILSKFDRFFHETESISNVVNKQLENIKGSFLSNILEMSIAYSMGHSVSEIVFNKKTWNLEELFILKPDKYDFYYNKEANELNIRYFSISGIKEIPLEKVVHVRSGIELAYNSPYGIRAADAVVPLWQSWLAVIGEMVNGAKTAASPYIFIKTPLEAPIQLLNSNGDPIGKEISAEDAATAQLKKLKNGSIAVIGTESELGSVSASSDPKFWEITLRQIEKLMLQAWLVPETILTTGGSGSGDSSLNTGHLAVFENSVNQLANQIKEELLEKVVRKIIVYNFGEQESYGEFLEPENSESERIQLLQILLNAVNNDGFTEQDKFLITDKFKKLSNLS